MHELITRTRRDRRREDGGVLVMVAVWLPVLILVMSLVLDIGNWFEHKRHLQMQADSGALAGAGLYGAALGCNDADIDRAVGEYSGEPTGKFGQATFRNLQVGGANQGAIHVLVNSTNYWNSGGTDFSDGGGPCEQSHLDVKITESSLPWFFRVAGTTINAHARIDVNQLSTEGGALPIAVPDPTPKFAKAFFVDESTGALLGAADLASNGTANGLLVWDNVNAPLAVKISAANVGVIIALSGGSSAIAGTPAAACSTFLVQCYDLGTVNGSGLPSQGILYIRGYTAPTGTDGQQPAVPKVGDVQLFGGTCTDPYFSNPTSTCAIGVRAQVAGTTSTGGNAGLAVYAMAPGCPTNGQHPGCPMTLSGGYWATAANAISVAPGSGPITVSLRWEETSGSVTGLGTCSTRNNNPCTGTISNVQRTFAAVDARSGPIKAAQILEGTSPDADSFVLNTTHNLVVRIGVLGTLSNATSVSSPPVSLRVVGSQNQSIDCDPAVSTLRDEIAQGCSPTYAINTGQACPAYNALWSTPQPWYCVKTQTGGSVGQVTQGMDQRILQGGSCAQHPNNWSSFPNLSPTDTRIVPVFVTPFGTFTGSGNDIVPVSNFATFYVTGWGHNGNGNGCPGDDPAPSGYIVGHFIKYIGTLPGGGGGTTPCDFSSFGTCVARLTN
jgi:Putative Flp pilus-assembly TadE/G-like